MIVCRRVIAIINFSCRTTTSSLPLRPPPLARLLSPKAERSPNDAFLHPTASADRFYFCLLKEIWHLLKFPLQSQEKGSLFYCNVSFVD